jgi:DNA repair protein RecN (Recombination protein N)
MLQELAIRNFALLEDVRITFGPGLNVLTGETGAGKSIIIDAIGAVLGGRTTVESIRTGTDRALVEAIFELDPDAPVAGPIRAALAELGLDDGEPACQLILARELSRSGRSVARINGRAVPATTLAQVGAYLVDIHGQHEHLSLLRPEAQRDLLDRYGGLTPLRAARAELRAMQQDEREIARQIDLLSFQVEEIRAAALTPGEEQTLSAERSRLANAVRLAELATAIHERLAGGEGDAPAALDLLGLAARDLAQLARIDHDMAGYEPMLSEATAQVDELARAFRAYAGSIEFSPERLAEVEERLDLIKSLQRKYGDTIEEVLAFGERAAAQLDALVNREARTAELERRVTDLEREIGDAAAALSAARALAAERLAAAVAAELHALGLGGHFFVSLHSEPDPDGVPVGGERVRFDESGIDLVEFRFMPNPGEPAKPVARTASGGELSRILLALKAVLSEADRTPTLIFDEVDVGIGGRSGRIVGERLAHLAGRHQVLCVTHLPQIAAYGDRHYYIAKEVRAGRTVTTVTPLDGEARERELAQMLGGVTVPTLEQARELCRRAAEWKQAGRLTAIVAAGSGRGGSAGGAAASARGATGRPVASRP